MSQRDSRVLNTVVITLVVLAIGVIWLMVATVPVWVSVGVIASLILIIVFFIALWAVSR